MKILKKNNSVHYPRRSRIFTGQLTDIERSVVAALETNTHQSGASCTCYPGARDQHFASSDGQQCFDNREPRHCGERDYKPGSDARCRQLRQ